MNGILIRKILLFCILLTCVSFGALAETSKKPSCEFNNYDGDVGRQKVIDLISSTFIEEALLDKNPKFEKLNSVINEIKNQDCKLQDGRPVLNFVLYGFEDAFTKIGDWNQILPKIIALKKAHPNAAYPVLVEADYWAKYAWIARGSGFASTVTPEGWKLLKERMAIAKSILIENKKIGSTLPAWYELMIKVETGLNSSQEAKDKYFVEGFSRYKTFLPLYIAKRNTLEPKWGGSWQEVDNFIKWSAENTKKTEGLSLYSQLYFGVMDNMLRGSNFWDDTLVKWPILKQGFEDLIRLNPKSQFQLNVYASMACEANDKETYFKIRNKIAKTIEWSWQVNYLAADCDSIYGYK